MSSRGSVTSLLGATVPPSPGDAAIASPTTFIWRGPTDAVTYFFSSGAKYWKRHGPTSFTPEDSGTSTYSQLFSPSRPDDPARAVSFVLGSKARKPLSSGRSGGVTERRFPFPAMERVRVTGSPAATSSWLTFAWSSNCPTAPWKSADRPEEGSGATTIVTGCDRTTTGLEEPLWDAH